MPDNLPRRSDPRQPDNALDRHVREHLAELSQPRLDLG
jgi:hypothetical protein